MTNVDQYESVFRAAARVPFQLQEVGVDRALVVTDLEPLELAGFAERLHTFLGCLGEVTWEVVGGEETRSTVGLLRLVEERRPDLICTYRHLHSEAWRYPHSLGEHLVVLTQCTPGPVLVMPHPRAGYASPHAMRNTDRVMAITDHLTGDHRLVSFAAAFTEPGGTLYLTHVEDEATFARYLATISRIPTLDTTVAREALRRQLRKEPRDYIGSCARVLREAGVSLQVEELVTFGHRLTDYREAVTEHELDLLVLNTKEEDQLAMHGLAYPLTVELRQIPLLLL